MTTTTPATKNRASSRRAPSPPATKRVAIYTRKNTEEGLDSEFNSLDAQRQAVEAYVASQRGEGWAALPERYDDGGFTGANVDRPAFQRLLADVAAGKIDVVAVYKIDRLSRSLVDFARTIETFEEHGVTFVSVTQQFSTTTSMGRLTLNILISFAEFERQVISERTRDKMIASRKKGLWIGGRPVLGYDARDKKLVVNTAEAEQVKTIFATYLGHGSLIATVGALATMGLRGKRLVSREGRVHAARPFDKSSLQRLLSNPIYVGKISHAGELFAGNHDPMVEQGVWDAVQQRLRTPVRGRLSATPNKWGALLKGIVFCGVCGHSLGHVFTQRNGRLYRYYQCQKSQKQGAAACPGSRAPAGQIEAAVVEQILSIGKDQAVLRETVAASKRASEERKPELTAELRRLEQEQRRLGGEQKNLLDAIANGGSGAATLATRLGEVEDSRCKADERAAAVRADLLGLEGALVDEDDLRSALAEFMPIWDQLFPRERARILQLLIERVTYTAATQELSIEFRPCGIKTLATKNSKRPV